MNQKIQQEKEIGKILLVTENERSDKNKHDPEDEVDYRTFI